MTNPILQHPVLQHLPYELLRQPTKEGIADFLSRRRKLLARIAVGLAVLSCLAPTLSEILAGYVPLSVWVMAVILAGMAFEYYRQKRMTRLSDQDISAALEQHSAPR